MKFKAEDKHGKKRMFLTCAVIAIAIWFGFPNAFITFPPLALLWPLGLVFLGIAAPTYKKALFQGWLATWAGSVCALYWLSYPVHDVGGLPWPLAYLCAAFICACLSTHGAIFCCVAWIVRSWSYVRKALFLALVWYLLEYCYAVCMGFPWLPISGALAVWPLMIQGADLVGAYFNGCLWIFGSLLCVTFIDAASPKAGLRALSGGICIFLLLVVYGMWRMQQTPEDQWPEGEGSMGAVFIEGNVEQNQKWLPAFQNRTLALYLRLTAAGVAEARERGIENPLIIWPETAMPFFFDTRPSMAEQVRDCAREFACPLVFGAPGVEKLPDLPEGAVFNRAFLLAPDGYTLGFYDKEHLVPFGEYLPDWLNLPFLEALLQGVGIYQEGTATAPLRYESLALGMLICYEGIFPWLARERVEKGANILLDISNDGWFGTSPAALQHLYLTVPRCVEQNRWLLRSTNTGISAVCDTRGRIVMAGGRFQAGYLPARARLLNEMTFYHKISPWLPLMALAIIILLFIARGNTKINFSGYVQK